MLSIMHGKETGVVATITPYVNGQDLLESPMLVYEGAEERVYQIVESLCKLQAIDTIIIRRSKKLYEHPHNKHLHLRHIWREVFCRQRVDEEERTAHWVIFTEDMLRSQVGLAPELESREAKEIIDEFLGTAYSHPDFGKMS